MLNAADVVLLVVIALSAVVGLWRGFLVEVMSVAVWLAAFWLAFAFGGHVAELFAGVVSAPSARLFLGYAAVFLAALGVGGLATWLIGKLVKSTGLSGTDRLLGLGFGVARGVALCCIGVLLLGFTPMPKDPWWQSSRLLPGFTSGAQWLRDWLPARVAEHVDFESLPALPDLPPLPDAAAPGQPSS
ncbi:MAG: CvpA family protein [Lysobacteraceae bacterium]